MARGIRTASVGLAMMAAASAAAAQTLTIGTKLQLNTMDPHFFNGFPANSAHPHIWDALTQVNERLEVEPQLAESWRLVDDTTWEFRLRRGVRFHDGTPFTAADVAATIARLPGVPNSPALFTPFTRGVREVQVVDAHTVRLLTSGPVPLQPFDIASVRIVSAGDRETTTQGFNDGRANGTGPYRFAAWTNGESLSVTRNPDHWGGPAPWARVEIRTITRDPSRVATLLAGEVDAIDLVPTGDKARIAADPRFRLVSGPAAVVHYIALDSARAQSPHVAARDGQPALADNPLRDARVRRALSLALDRDAISQRLMEGSAAPASQFLPAGFEGTSQRLVPGPHDPDRARALLREAGYPNGFRLVLHTTTDRYPKDAQIAQAVGQMWTRIGVQVDVTGVPGQVFFGAATRQEFSAFIAQYGTSYALEGPRAVIHTNEAARGLGAANRVRYSNPAVDAAIRAALGEMDATRRIGLTQRAIEMAMEDTALIPVFHPTWDYAVRRGVALTSTPQRRMNALMIRPD